jgi:glutaredoxin 3
MADVGSQKPIEIYTTDWCPYCVRAKALLSRKGWAYTEVNVDGDVDKRAWLVETTGRRTVPQIFIGGTPVGGFDDIAALDRKGELERMVKGA